MITALVTKRCTSLEMSRCDYRFSRREIREHTNWSDTALKVHLARLAEMEYLLVHRGGRGQSYVYELLYQGEGEQGEPFLMGLIDVEKLRYDEKKSGRNDHRSGSGQPPVRGQSGGGQDDDIANIACNSSVSDEIEDEPAEKALLRRKRGNGSYSNHRPAMSAKTAD